MNIIDAINQDDLEAVKNDVLTVGVGILAVTVGFKLLDKIMTSGMTEEEKRKYKRKRASKKWSRYSVKRWKSKRN